MGKNEKLSRSYEFFLKHEDDNKSFTRDELKEFTKWSDSTIMTYLSKKWNTLITKKDELFYVNGIINFTKEEYERMMSQAQKTI